jgi:transcriptional regulator with XRE-family HTH domain
MRTLATVKLSACRKRRFLSQHKLAAKAGVAVATVFNIEKGIVKTPRLDVIRRISEALEMDATEIDEFKAALDAE